MEVGSSLFFDFLFLFDFFHFDCESFKFSIDDFFFEISIDESLKFFFKKWIFILSINNQRKKRNKD